MNRTVGVSIVGAVLFGIFAATHLFSGRVITVNNGPGADGPVSAITGEPCTGASRRPIAVMLSSDPEARPLSGIGQADLVFEMPVTPNGVTRSMALFQCHNPAEIGSIRSARGDFIPLAQGSGVILAHWGGEHGVLDKLRAHVLDNIDGLTYDGSTFLRKKGVPGPHNGFTTPALLRERASVLGYRMDAPATPLFPHRPAKPERTLGSLAGSVSVPWLTGREVVFRYDPTRNTYARWRGGTPEIDATTNEQVHVAVVAVMETDATFLYDQYISVRTLGRGVVHLYQDGRLVDGRWQKRTVTDPLRFEDDRGESIPLTPGPIWVLINAPLPNPT